MNFEEANKIFEGIFSRGTQWEMVEEYDIYKELKDIDMCDDWSNYGNNQDKAAKIFNDMKLGWRVMRVFFDENCDEQIIDYFDKDDKWDYDEFSIKIEKVEEK